VATGKIKTRSTGSCGGGYSTSGLESIHNITNQMPHQGVSECYTWDQFETCTVSQIAMLRAGTAITRDFVMVGYQTANGSVYY
jgi:carboxypeptidase D